MKQEKLSIYKYENKYINNKVSDDDSDAWKRVVINKTLSHRTGKLVDLIFSFYLQQKYFFWQLRRFVTIKSSDKFIIHVKADEHKVQIYCSWERVCCRFYAEGYNID